jgi:SNF2 family DNA or RNA helicase
MVSYDVPVLGPETQQKTPLPQSQPAIDMPEALTNRMFDHQKEGVQWMYGLRGSHSGGILGDDMV